MYFTILRFSAVLCFAKKAQVLVEDANTFMPLRYYSPTGPDYYYVLDWDSALHSSSLHATVQSKLMRNARAVGYGGNRIIDTAVAQCDLDKFAVLDSPGISWFETRILNNPAFEARKVADLDFRDPGPTHVWVVTRLFRDPECLHQQ